jgi:HSP20 family protein
MDRIFDDFFGGGPAFLRPETGDWDWSPPVDISETGDHVEFRAEVPGLSKEDVSVAVTENVLTLKGEKKQESEVKDETVIELNGLMVVSTVLSLYLRAFGQSRRRRRSKMVY